MRVLGAERIARVGGWLLARVGRPTFVLLACSVAVGVFLVGAVAVSGGRVLGPAGTVSRRGPSLLRLRARGRESALGRDRARDFGRFADDLTVTGTGTVSFSAVVEPDGHATTAYFEFGLGTRYREPRPSGVVYDEATPMVDLGASFGPHLVSGVVSGLVPNALYHLRLVASNSAGTVYSPDATFRTAKDPAPSLPLIGATVNVAPLSGLVLIRPPRVNSSRASDLARLVEGGGFLPLTETRQLPIDSLLDARAGAVRMVIASPRLRHTDRITLAGGLLSLSQTRYGPEQALTTLHLLEGDFRGAPTYTRCSAHNSADVSSPDARTRRPSSLVLQTLRARDQGGRFRTGGRYSTATVSRAGTVWDTIDRCDGTLTIVHRGTAIVSDLVRGRRIAVHAGQRYLATAP